MNWRIASCLRPSPACALKAARVIANPDLPDRLRRNLPLNPYDRATFFGGTDAGYTDYPSYDDESVAA